MKKSYYFLFLFCIIITVGNAQIDDDISLNPKTRVNKLITAAELQSDENWLVAIENYILAEQLAVEHNLNEELFIIYDKLTFLYLYKSNDNVETLNYYQKHYNLAGKVGDTVAMMETLIGIGEIYERFKDYPTTEHYYKKVDSLNNIAKNLKCENCLRLNLTHLYANMGKYDKMFETLDLIEKSIAENPQKNDDYIQLATYVNISGAYLEMSNYQKSIEFANKSNRIIKDNPSRSLYLPYVWVMLSRNNYHLKNYAASVIYGDSAISNVKRHYNDRSLDVDFYNAYSESLQELGQSEKAIAALQKFIAKSDTISNEKLEIQGTYVKANVKIKERINSLESDRKAALIDLNKTERRNLILLFIALTTILLAIILRFKLKKNQLANELLELKEEQLKKTIDAKNREVAAKMLRITNTQNALSQISNELKGAEKDLKATPEIRELLNTIKHKVSAANNTNFWTEFKKRFEEIHPDFYTTLIKHHDNLTRGEQMLCAYLKLHLNTKEIATISGTAVKTVEVNRSRLRKKLGINNKEINLNTYIQQLQ